MRNRDTLDLLDFKGMDNDVSPGFGRDITRACVTLVYEI